MSGDRITPRFDVVATTRRSWSKAQKKTIVAEIDVGGATLSEVARRHGMHASLLFRWRRDLGSAMGAPPIDAGAALPGPTVPRFVPIMLPPPVVSASVPTKPGMIEIVLAGGRTVRVDSNVDIVALRRIVDALERHAEGVREIDR